MKEPLRQAIIDGDADTAAALTEALLASGASAREILDEALLPGMEVVGGAPVTAACAQPPHAGMAVERVKELVG